MTLKNVALLSGCAVSTVSKVLKNSAEISDETKQRVLKAAKQCGYLEKATARSAVLGGLQTVVIADERLRLSGQLAALSETAARYDLTLLYTACNEQTGERLTRQSGSVGMITVSASKTAMLSNTVLRLEASALPEAEEFFRHLQEMKPTRAPRSGATSAKLRPVQPSVPKAEKTQEAKEEIWLL